MSNNDNELYKDLLTPADYQPVYCEKCGTKMEYGCEFCTACGNHLEYPVEAAPVAVNPTMAAPNAAYGQPDAVPHAAEFTPPQKKKSPLPLILSMVAGIVLAGGIGVAIFFMMSKSDDDGIPGDDGYQMSSDGRDSNSGDTQAPNPDNDPGNTTPVDTPPTPKETLPPLLTPPPTPDAMPTPNPYDDIYFVIPDSNVRELTYDDLRGLSAWELRVARNEIYARHGRQFSAAAQDLQDYFNTMPWYIDLPKLGYDGNGQPIEPGLSSLEMSNAVLILEYERRLS